MADPKFVNHVEPISQNNMKARVQGVVIETRNFGFRSKTWSCLVLGLLCALNFLVTGNCWPAGAKWPVHTAFVGWLIVSTLAFILGIASEIRRKPGANELQQIIIRQSSGQELEELEAANAGHL